MVSFGLALGILLLWLLLSADWYVGLRRTPFLNSVLNGEQVRAGATYPHVAIIIPTRNEELALEAGLESVLRQDYPRTQVLVVDDRSTDLTPIILARLQAQWPELEVLQVKAVEPGWLGKNHALQRGVSQLEPSSDRERWLLFTDADVILEPYVLRAAVAYAQTHELDHLTAFPLLFARGPLLKSFVAVFAQLFSFATLRASAAQQGYVGVGAFNLLKQTVYETIGGHRRIALRPDDDMQLAKLVRRAGFRTGVVLAPESVRVEWYSSLSEAIRGLNKNAFAGLFYSWPLVVLVSLALLLTHVWPFVAIFVTSGWTQLSYLLVWLVIFGVYVLSRPVTQLSPVYTLFHPLGVLLLVYAILESAVKVTWHGGVHWRETFYALELLKHPPTKK